MQTHALIQAMNSGGKSRPSKHEKRNGHDKRQNGFESLNQQSRDDLVEGVEARDGPEVCNLRRAWMLGDQGEDRGVCSGWHE